jgi:uncharacterized membrane protein YtjA (UPF0391 family)
VQGLGGTNAAGLRCPSVTIHERIIAMFGWAITFHLVALIAAAFGFGAVAGTAMSAAQIVFVVALIAFVISAVMGYRGRGI